VPETIVRPLKREAMARAFDPETVNLIAAVYNAAWQEIEAAAAKPMPLAQRTKASTALAKHIMAAVEAGQRDPDKLKLIALQAMKLK
jgi:hypothetical protein